MTLSILIPAAGSSARMRGTDKLLQPIDNEPILRRIARIALTVTPDVIVTLRDPDLDRRTALHGLPVEILTVPDAASGMAASLRAGAFQTQTDALMILPADMPDLTAADLQTMAAAQAQTPGTILRATDASGTPGHPVILPAALYSELAELQGDQGAREILTRHKVQMIPLPGTHATTDLDTPEDWAAYRRSKASAS